MKPYFIGLVVAILVAHLSHGLLLLFIVNRNHWPIEAEYWVREELLFKQSLAQRAGDGKRILILSGSSGLFGIDSAMIERRTGLKTVNLSTHVALPLSFQLQYADQIVRAGDLIILPLEYEYYAQPPSRISAWWGQTTLAVFPEVFQEMPMLDRLKALLHIKPQTLWGGLYVSARRLVQPGFMEQRRLLDSESILSKWRNAPHAGLTQYGVEGTDEHGDIERNRESRNARWHYSIATASFDVDRDAVGLLKRYVVGWKERGVQTHVTFPPVAVDVLATPHFRENAEKLNTLLEREGVSTIGKPGDFVFPRKAFFDTPNHLNCDSRVDRTAILLRHLMSSARFEDRGR